MKIFNLFILLTLVSLLSSCSKNETTSTAVESVITIDMINTADSRSKGNVGALDKEENVSFVVVYTGNLDDILTDSESDLNTIIQSEGFGLEKPVAIDETMHSILFTTTNIIEDPVALGKEISLCSEVMMVEVKHAPTPTEELAS